MMALLQAWRTWQLWRASFFQFITPQPDEQWTAEHADQMQAFLTSPTGRAFMRQMQFRAQYWQQQAVIHADARGWRAGWAGGYHGALSTLYSLSGKSTPQQLDTYEVPEHGAADDLEHRLAP